MRRSHSCRIVVMVLAALILGSAPAGCTKKKVAESEPTGNPLRPDPGGAPAKNVVQRGAQRQVNQQLLKNIGQYYELFRTENGRAPRDLAEFLTYVKNDPNARTAKVPQALEDGWVVLVFTPNLSGDKVLAYEKEAFQQFQNRLVLLGDCSSVRLMTEPEFQAALQAP